MIVLGDESVPSLCIKIQPLSDKFHFAYMAFQSNEMILVVSFEQTMTHDSQFPADRSAQAH